MKQNFMLHKMDGVRFPTYKVFLYYFIKQV